MVTSLLETRVHRVEQAPLASYVLYNIGHSEPHTHPYISYVLRSDYDKFARMLLTTAEPSHKQLTLDLNFAQCHTLVLDLDATVVDGEQTMCFTRDSAATKALEVLHSILLHSPGGGIENFTVIVAFRDNSAGMHLHLPEFLVCNDDYERFCSLVQSQFSFTVDGGVRYSLDVPSNWSVPGSPTKPDRAAYKPFLVAYMDDQPKAGSVANGTTCYQIRTSDSTYFAQTFDFLTRKGGGFKRTKKNLHSFFRGLLRSESEGEFMQSVLLAMMPVPVSDHCEPLYRLSYETKIEKCDREPEDDTHHQVVATFVVQSSPFSWGGSEGDASASGRYVVLKSKRPNVQGRHWLKTRRFLEQHADAIEHFETDVHALHLWFKRLRVQAQDSAPPGDTELWRLINLELVRDNPHLRSKRYPDPLKAILEYDQGFYFLPCFYSLAAMLVFQHSRQDVDEDPQLHPHGFPSVHELVQALRAFVDPQFHGFLDRLDSVPESLLKVVCRFITVDTIHYCGHHLYPKPRSMNEKISTLLDLYHRALLQAADDPDAMIDLIRTIQRRHFPLMKNKPTDSNKVAVRYIWNFHKNSWCEVHRDTEVFQHMQNIWNEITAYVRKHRDDLKQTAWEKGIRLQNVVQAILSDSNIEQRCVSMDRQSWLLRVAGHSTLDLLTYHVGATVPEFYISGKQLGLELPRKAFVRLLERTPLTTTSHVLGNLYAWLTTKRFFRQFLCACYEDTPPEVDVDPYVRILQGLVPGPIHEHGMSMLRAWIHLCKYAAFEYDRLMYLLDLLASALVATNHERKFVVLKGLTRNGKSKLSQLLARVFGGYYATIRSECLRPPSHGSGHSGPNPDLASTLFSCRIIYCDEIGGKINENLVKEITGNTPVTMRNMYELSQGGVPTAKIFASTNTPPDVTTSEAFCDRVVAIPFASQFVEDAPLRVLEQVQRNQYPVDKKESLVEEAHIGFFALLWFHFVTHVNQREGYLHYRKMPPSLVAYKTDYLAGTSLYHQFKRAMDVQEITNHVITKHELKSAARQFLTMCKDRRAHNEEDLERQFDKEYRHLKRADLRLMNYTAHPEKPTILQDDEADEEAELPKKRAKREDDDVSSTSRDRSEAKYCVYYYENIAIKNLKKFSLVDM